MRGAGCRRRCGVVGIYMKRIRVIRRRHIGNGRPVELVVERILRFRKLLDGLPHAASAIGQFLCAEKKEDHNEYDEHIGAGEVSEESEQGRSGHSFVAFMFVALGRVGRNGRFPFDGSFSP